MEGIDAILQAEKEAERIRQEAREAADALLGSVEGYRQRVLDEAQREGEETQQHLLEQAEQRAEARKAELRALADVKDAELRSAASGKLEAAAQWIAERIAEG